jgi:NAD(P)-dependent dehydrogenase (short-subunit alcohol dehydrogenase family)
MLIDLPVDAWRRQIDVNLTGAFLTAQASARAMRRAGRGGQIVFISSWVQDVPRENIGAYCASKGGMKMLSKCLALELARDRIRVNAVAPGFVDAGLTGENLRRNPDRRPGIEASVALGRLVTAEELARAVVMLCSDDAAYLTGTSLLVDGGSSLFPAK